MPQNWWNTRYLPASVLSLKRPCCTAKRTSESKFAQIRRAYVADHRQLQPDKCRCHIYITSAIQMAQGE